MGAMEGIALVLGAGGVAGGAWHAGALAALADVTRWDPRDAGVIVGTSAGSITGAGLRAGLDAEDHWRLAVGGNLSPSGARLYSRIRTAQSTMTRARPTRPAPANPTLVRAMVGRDPRLGVALAGLLPEGSLSAAGIANRIDELSGGAWPARPLWVVAVDLASGRRAIFGRDGTGAAAGGGPTLGQAVAASCAVPAFFAPVTIGGRRYVDGGVHSPTNADLVAGAGARLVVVSAPMAGRWRSMRPHPQSIARTAARINLDREVAAIRRAGMPVLVLQPGTDDTPLMDGRSMDPGAREPVARQARASVAATLAAADPDVLARFSER
jgi:NTE family protein